MVKENGSGKCSFEGEIVGDRRERKKREDMIE